MWLGRLSPHKICEKGYRQINAIRSESAAYQNVKAEAMKVNMLWVWHTDGTCTECDKYATQSIGGAPIKVQRCRPRLPSGPNPSVSPSVSHKEIDSNFHPVDTTIIVDMPENSSRTEVYTPIPTVNSFRTVMSTPIKTCPETINQNVQSISMDQGIQTMPTINTSMHLSMNRSIQSFVKMWGNPTYSSDQA